jgi:hypothetical protein
MVLREGGLEAAHFLLASQSFAEGLARLAECGRSDLSVEHLVTQPEWRELFTESEIQIARDRLAMYKFGPR